ncbi:MAG: hypothetical protein JEZ14_02795 [Marinilabiliaceae bacterium]|nr:hypothetical protein [Marinilabiliaceae bacterium]
MEYPNLSMCKVAGDTCIRIQAEVKKKSYSQGLCPQKHDGRLTEIYF